MHVSHTTAKQDSVHRHECKAETAEKIVKSSNSRINSDTVL